MSTNFHAQQETKQGPSVGTIVWGAVVVAIAGLLVASRLGWFTVDAGVAAVGLLLLAGLGLVVGGSLAASRSRKRLDGAASTGERSAHEPGTAPSSDVPSTDPTTGQPPRNPYEAPGPYEGPTL